LHLKQQFALAKLAVKSAYELGKRDGYRQCQEDAARAIEEKGAGT
jgi:hypothetical protein